jgi:hypothetical protein
VRHYVNRVECDCHIACVVGSDVLRLPRLHHDKIPLKYPDENSHLSRNPPRITD